MSVTKQPPSLFRAAQPRSAGSPGCGWPRCGAAPLPGERGSPAAAFRPLPPPPGVPSPLPRRSGAEQHGKCGALPSRAPAGAGRSGAGCSPSERGTRSKAVSWLPGQICKYFLMLFLFSPSSLFCCCSESGKLSNNNNKKVAVDISELLLYGKQLPGWRREQPAVRWECLQVRCHLEVGEIWQHYPVNAVSKSCRLARLM